MSLFHQSNPSTVEPKHCNIAKSHGLDFKIAIKNMNYLKIKLINSLKTSIKQKHGKNNSA